MGASPVVSPSVTFPVLELQVHSVPGLELGVTLHRSSYRGSLRGLAYPIHEWSPVSCSGCRYPILLADTDVSDPARQRVDPLSMAASPLPA